MIFVVFTEKPFIEIKEPWRKVWELNVEEQTSIPVKYTAYPDPELKWYVHSRRKAVFAAFIRLHRSMCVVKGAEDIFPF